LVELENAFKILPANDSRHTMDSVFG